MPAHPSPQTIVLIHGLWMTPRSWEQWVDRYSSRGHRVLAPAWPGMEADVEELRRDPSPMTKLDITKVVDHYDGIIRGLDSPPIVMGHSAGGLFVQLLLDRGLASAGVGVGSGRSGEWCRRSRRSARRFPCSATRSTAARRPG